MNIFTVLKKDHREVQDLFKDILKDEDDLDEDKVETLCQMLTVHMELEEKLFYPELKRHKETSDMEEEAELEHAEAKTLVRALKKGGLDNTEMKVKIEMLQLAINHHIEEEEKEVFPEAKEIISDDKISSIAEKFTAEKEKRMARAIA